MVGVRNRGEHGYRLHGLDSRSSWRGWRQKTRHWGSEGLTPTPRSSPTKGQQKSTAFDSGFLTTLHPTFPQATQATVAHPGPGVCPSSGLNPPMAGADSVRASVRGRNTGTGRPRGTPGRCGGGSLLPRQHLKSPSVAGSRRSTHPYISAQAQSSADEVMSWQATRLAPAPGVGGAPGHHSPLREGVVEGEGEGEEGVGMGEGLEGRLSELRQRHCPATWAPPGGATCPTSPGALPGRTIAPPAPAGDLLRRDQPSKSAP